MKALILGGGLSGTVAALTLKDYFEEVQIVTLPNKGNTAPFMHIRSMPKNKAILKLVGIDNFQTNIWNLGYEWQGHIYKTSNPTMHKAYMEKCYGTANFDNIPLYETNFKVYTTSFSEVLQKAETLTKNITINDKITSINVKDKIVYCSEGRKEHYDFLVNTIALPDFISLTTGQQIEMKANPVYVYNSDKDIGNYGTVHVMDVSNPITRYHRECKGPRVFAESMKPTSEKPIAYFKYGKILYEPSTTAYRNLSLSFFEALDIISVGRFSNWKQHYDVENSVSDLNYWVSNKMVKRKLLI